MSFSVRAASMALALSVSPAQARRNPSDRALRFERKRYSDSDLDALLGAEDTPSTEVDAASAIVWRSDAPAI